MSSYIYDWQDARELQIDYFRHHNDYQFCIGGSIYSFHFGIFITDMRVFSAPERDITFQSVAGRNGDILFDNKRMKNIDIVYSCAITKNFRLRFDAFKNSLYRLSGYQKIVDSTDSGIFRMGIVHAGIEPTVIRRGHGGTFDLRISCKPQKFLESGTYEMKFSDTPMVQPSNPFGRMPNAGGWKYPICGCFHI